MRSYNNDDDFDAYPITSSIAENEDFQDDVDYIQRQRYGLPDFDPINSDEKL